VCNAIQIIPVTLTSRLRFLQFTIAKAAKKSKLGDYATIQLGKWYVRIATAFRPRQRRSSGHTCPTRPLVPAFAVS
jgi:hypothetical protein